MNVEETSFMVACDVISSGGGEVCVCVCVCVCMCAAQIFHLQNPVSSEGEML